MKHELRVASYELLVTSWKLKSTIWNSKVRVQTANYELKSMSSNSRVESLTLRVTRVQLHEVKLITWNLSATLTKGSVKCNVDVFSLNKYII